MEQKTDKKKHKWLVRLLCVVAALLVLAGTGYAYFALCMNPHRGEVRQQEYSLELEERLSGEQAQEDLQFLMRKLQERHPMFLEKGNARVADATAQYEQELEKASDGCTVLELNQACGRIVAKLGDGHTRVSWNGENPRYLNDLTQLQQLGSPLTINGVSSEQVFAEFKKVFPHETESYAKQMFYSQAICSENYLRLSGVDTSEGVTMTFSNQGIEEEYTYQLVPYDRVEGRGKAEVDSEDSGDNSGTVYSFVSYRIDEPKHVGIFVLDECVCDDIYLETLDDFFREGLDKGVEHVVVDLRNNGGGNSWVANEFIRYLDVDEYRSWDTDIRFGWYQKKYRDIVQKNDKKPQVFTGDVYVLTSTFTYSAAMDFAMLMEDNDLGKLIGEPSGNLPDSYGDLLFFQLPNSKLLETVSFKKWYRIDQTKSGEPLMPDYPVESADALEKAYEVIAGK